MKKIEEVEILRAFAILGVVAIHVIAGTINKIEDHSNYIFIINTVLNTFSHFAVPLFFTISGLVLGLKYKGNYDLSDYYKKRLISTVPPYIVFSLIYIVFDYFKNPVNWPLSLSSILFRLLTGTAFIHTWFFIVLIQFYILFPLLCKFIDKIDSKKTYATIFICLLVSQISWNAFLMRYLTHPYFIDISVFIRNIFLSHVIYFVLGIFISKNFDAFRDKLSEIKCVGIMPIFIILLTILSYTHTVGNHSFGILYQFAINTLNVSLYICTFILLFNLSEIIIRSNNYLKSLLHSLSKYSYGIFLIHLLVLIKITHISKTFSETYYYNWQYYLVSFTMTVLLSAILVKLIALLPFGKAIVGVKSRSLAIKNK